MPEIEMGESYVNFFHKKSGAQEAMQVMALVHDLETKPKKQKKYEDN